MGKLFSSIQNIFWYRRPKLLSRKTLFRINRVALSDSELALTELLLQTVGLRVIFPQVTGGSSSLDGVYLTAIQKESKVKAESHGYRVGLA